jgi:hypothetical protein
MVVSGQAQLEIGASQKFNPLLSDGVAYGLTQPETEGQFSSVGATVGGVEPGATGEYRDAQDQVVPSATLQLRRLSR